MACENYMKFKCHYSSMKFYWNTATPILLCTAAVMLEWQSCVVETEIVWFEKSKIFSIWPFTEKICWSLVEKKMKTNTFFSTHFHSLRWRSAWNIWKQEGLEHLWDVIDFECGPCYGFYLYFGRLVLAHTTVLLPITGDFLVLLHRDERKHM